jgi:hypothetical protein
MARFLTAISSFPVIGDLSFPPAGQWRKPDPLRQVLGRQRNLPCLEPPPALLRGPSAGECIPASWHSLFYVVG